MVSSALIYHIAKMRHTLVGEGLGPKETGGDGPVDSEMEEYPQREVEEISGDSPQGVGS